MTCKKSPLFMTNLKLILVFLATIAVSDKSFSLLKSVRHISPSQHHQTDLILWLYLMYVNPWLPIWISLTYFKSYWQSRPLFGIFSWQYEIVNTSTDYEASCNETQPEEDLEKELCHIWDRSYWKIVKDFLKPLRTPS